MEQKLLSELWISNQTKKIDAFYINRNSKHVLHFERGILKRKKYEV